MVDGQTQRQVGELGPVTRRIAPSQRPPVIEMPQLHPQNRRLKRIDPEVAAPQVVDVFGRAVLTHDLRACRPARRFAGHHRATVACRTQVFGRKEAQRRGADRLVGDAGTSVCAASSITGIPVATNWFTSIADRTCEPAESPPCFAHAAEHVAHVRVEAAFGDVTNTGRAPSRNRGFRCRKKLYAVVTTSHRGCSQRPCGAEPNIDSHRRGQQRISSRGNADDVQPPR